MSGSWLRPNQARQGDHRNQGDLYIAPDMVTAGFEFASGLTGTDSCCFSSAPCAKCHITGIIDSKGMVEYATFRSAEVLLETKYQGSQRFNVALPQPIQQPLIQTIVDFRLGTGHCLSPGNKPTGTKWVMEPICK